MAHAASQIKKNKDVDINALEDEKEKKRKSRKQLREQKKKVPGMHPHTYVLLQGDWLGLWDISPVTACEFIVCVCVCECVKSVLQCQGYTLHLLLAFLLT